MTIISFSRVPSFFFCFVLLSAPKVLKVPSYFLFSFLSRSLSIFRLRIRQVFLLAKFLYKEQTNWKNWTWTFYMDSCIYVYWREWSWLWHIEEMRKTSVDTLLLKNTLLFLIDTIFFSVLILFCVLHSSRSLLSNRTIRRINLHLSEHEKGSHQTH